MLLAIITTANDLLYILRIYLAATRRENIDGSFLWNYN